MDKDAFCDAVERAGRAYDEARRAALEVRDATESAAGRDFEAAMDDAAVAYMKAVRSAAANTRGTASGGN